ncbi:MAG: class II glutamine amidotransferase, partial [Actinobacteria bacterium]|nr:class II glutamine amidotransferase [Actinomycetota bacterium]
MCGIVGYVGPRPALDVIVEGLRRLEYRGYDSAGVAVVTEAGQLEIRKKAGRIENLDKEIAAHPLHGMVGIGHTRWATHGAPNDRNAHPHVDAGSRIAVVHNGIIENFAALKAELQAGGVVFASDTDTEIVAHLLAAELRALGGSTADALRAVCLRLEGAFTLVVI